jgi:hypothetical protein
VRDRDPLPEPGPAHRLAATHGVQHQVRVARQMLGREPADEFLQY